MLGTNRDCDADPVGPIETDSLTTFQHYVMSNQLYVVRRNFVDQSYLARNMKPFETAVFIG